MIDPLRKRQDEARAKKLTTFVRLAMHGARQGDDRQVAALGAIARGIDKNWPVPDPFNASTAEELLPPPRSRAVATELVKDAIEPLQRAITGHARLRGPIIVVMNDMEYELAEPVAYTSQRSLIAPLTSHACHALVEEVAALHYVVHDPGARMELAIERARYGRERTHLIQLEHWLWEQAGRYGGVVDRIPYAHRLTLLLAAWHPSAHEPPGAWTLCVRCGELLYRKKRSFTSLPRCLVCMKETAQQREWPPHALAPHDQGTWFLQCQYPSCEMAFTGPRHRKLCPEHTSSRLPPSRRLSREPGRITAAAHPTPSLPARAGDRQEDRALRVREPCAA